jgi:hypothetical protein
MDKMVEKYANAKDKSEALQQIVKYN